jgi:hypothetical protein
MGLHVTAQLDLLLFTKPRRRGRGPSVIQGEVDAFILVLYRQGWKTSQSLGATTEKQKRTLRAVAAASKGHIISGQGGYRLNFEANADENRIAVSWFKHQMEEMRRRVIEIERVYHSKEIPSCLRDQVEKDRPAA